MDNALEPVVDGKRRTPLVGPETYGDVNIFYAC